MKIQQYNDCASVMPEWQLCFFITKFIYGVQFCSYKDTKGVSFDGADHWIMFKENKGFEVTI